MKKFLLFICLIGTVACFNKVAAQQRIQITKDVAIVSYGNVNVIEDDKAQMTYEIKVAKTDDDLYEVFCNNRFVKKVTKGALTITITSAVTSATGGVGAMGKIVIGAAVDEIYDRVCDYYGEKKEK
ncbi:MAG: hypothetical protein J6W30_04745 [Bacteroidales bacterium]|nr:hypothetical protein [Bacteroidales bacterium]